jgi:hypothetical protein
MELRIRDAALRACVFCSCEALEFGRLVLAQVLVGFAHVHVQSAVVRLNVLIQNIRGPLSTPPGPCY